MIRPPLLLLGAGGHALSCMDVLRLEDRHQVVGLVGRAEEVGREVDGVPVLGDDETLSALLGRFGRALVTVGQIRSSVLRRRLFSAIEAAGAHAPVIVSPRAYVSPRARLGPGTIVMHDAVVNAGAEVGRNCIINTRALIEHGSRIGDHCHVATGAIVNGDVHVGAGSFVGSGAVIRQGVVIGEGGFVRMGELIKADHAAERR